MIELVNTLQTARGGGGVLEHLTILGEGLVVGLKSQFPSQSR